MSKKIKNLLSWLLDILVALYFILGPTIGIVALVGAATLREETKLLRSELSVVKAELQLRDTTLIVEEPAETTAPPENPAPSEPIQATPTAKQPVVPVAPGEEELLVRLVIAEGGNQPYEGQVAVAQVVCDRYVAGYGDSITDVIYAKNQFATPYSKDISDYPRASEAVHAVLYEGARAFTETTIFFCNPDKSNASALAWMRTKPYIGTIADHEFYGV